MIKHWKLGAAVAALLLAGGAYAFAAGAGNIVSSVKGTDLIPIDSNTLATDASVDTIKSYMMGALGNTVITGTLDVTGVTTLGGAVGAASVTVPVVASSVNEISLAGAATGGLPLITVGGASADANSPLAIDPAGTGALYLGGTTTANSQFVVANTASSVDYLNVTGAATGNPANVTISSLGTDTNVGILITPKGSGTVKIGGTIATCTGTTTATCQGQRFVASVTGLTTAAAGVSSAAMTVTNANVTSSASIVECQVNGYSGTGQPVATNVTPGTGTVSFQVTNVANSGALNATVPVACMVFGT